MHIGAEQNEAQTEWAKLSIVKSPAKLTKNSAVLQTRVGTLRNVYRPLTKSIIVCLPMNGP